METQGASRGAVFAAIAFSLSCICLTLYVWTSFGGSTPLTAQGYRFDASFLQAANLAENADVRIAGVNVGKVRRVEDDGLRARATIELDREYAPIPSDTRAILRQKTLLGETFVALTPGTEEAPKLEDGGTLAIDRIAQTQNVDQVLGAFDAQTREAFKKFLSEFSDALEGRGQDINDALGNAGPAAADLNTALQILDRQDTAVQRLVRDTGSVFEGLGERQAEIQRLVDGGREVFGATAARNRELTETVRLLPGFLGDLRETFTSLESTAGEIGPALRDLRPAAPLVRPALEAANSLAPELEGAFRDLAPALRSLRRNGPGLRRIVAAADSLMDQLAPAGQQLVPVVELLEVYRREVVTQVANVAASTNATTEEGEGQPRRHYLRTLVPITNESLVGFGQRLGSNRYNPYFAPGALEGIGRDLRSFSCAHTGNPQTVPVIGGSGPPPCLEQSPWTFRGQTRAYPHVEPAR